MTIPAKFGSYLVSIEKIIMQNANDQCQKLTLTVVRWAKNELNLEEKKNHCTYKPEALKSLYRSRGYKKNQLVLCKNYVLQW
jgi:hypothetical protein